MFRRRRQIEMVGPNAGGEEEAKLRRLFDSFSGDVGRPKRRGDHDVRCGQLLIKLRLSIGQRNQFVAPHLQHLTQPKSVFRASQELRGLFSRRTTRIKNGDDFHGLLLSTESYLFEKQDGIQIRTAVCLLKG